MLKNKCICVELSEQKRNIAENLYKEWNENISFCDMEKLPSLQKQDCIYIDLMQYNSDFEPIERCLSSLVKDSSFVIIKGIRTKKAHQLLWKRLRTINRVTASMDLYHMGILFFNPKLHKRNYRISF